MDTKTKLADAYLALDQQEAQMRRSKAYIALLKRQLMEEEGWGAIPRDERVRDMVNTREPQDEG